MGQLTFLVLCFFGWVGGLGLYCCIKIGGVFFGGRYTFVVRWGKGVV